MQTSTTPPNTYTRTAIALHWVVALLMLVNIGLGLAADHLPTDWIRSAIDAHKSFGITVLGLALLRLLWRAAHRPPPLPEHFGRAERLAAHAGHALLYTLMIGLPLSGWLHDSAWKDAATYPMRLFGTVPWPRIGLVSHLDGATKEAMHGQLGQLHRWLSYAFYALFATHLAGALKHQLVDNDHELQRMGLGSRTPSPNDAPVGARAGTPLPRNSSTAP
jgi:cytochrome b561